MAVNLSDTTPAAPAGTVNGHWQQDGSGNTSVNVPAAAVELTANSVDATAQAANIAATNLVASAANAMYRVSITIIVSQVATTSSTLPSVNILWTDRNNGTVQTVTLTAASPSANTLTTQAQGSVILSAQSTTPIQYSTTAYASVGGTPMQYALHIRIEQL